LRIASMIMRAESSCRLIESVKRLGESYGQSHGVNPVRRAVFWVNHGNCLVSGHHAGIVDSHLRIAHLRRRNPGGIERSNGLRRRFGDRPSSDLRVELAVVPHARVTRAKTLI